MTAKTLLCTLWDGQENLGRNVQTMNTRSQPTISKSSSPNTYHGIVTLLTPYSVAIAEYYLVSAEYIERGIVQDRRSLDLDLFVYL